MPDSPDCFLCGQILGQPQNDLIARLLQPEPYVRRILLEDQCFAAMPSLGELTPGHSLVCTKQHLPSFSVLSGPLLCHFQKFKNDLIATLEQLYAMPVHIFEHGMASNGKRIPCTVDHAHMHFVPLPFTFDSRYVSALDWQPLATIQDLSSVAAGGEYVYYQDANRSSYALTGDFMESQLMRKLIAKGLGESHRWNWRDQPKALHAHDSWSRFVGHSSPRKD